MAGRNITEYLIKLLLHRGYVFNRTADFDTVIGYIVIMKVLFQPSLIESDSKSVAEELLDSIQSADMDLRPDFYKHIVLSGGTTMLPGSHRCAFLSEGNDVQMPGLPTRLEKELRSLHQKLVKSDGPSKLKIRIEDPPRRKHLDKDEFWASKKVMFPVQKDMIVTSKQEYFEKGPSYLSENENLWKF
eukprot:760057-Hanusia_phi.AAC.3